MRTTLDIDDDLMVAAKELARRERSSAGKVVSRLLRQSLTSAGPAAREGAAPHAVRWRASTRFRRCPAWSSPTKT